MTNLEALIYIAKQLKELDEQVDTSPRPAVDFDPWRIREPNETPARVSLSDASREELQAEIYKRRAGHMYSSVRVEDTVPFNEAVPLSVPVDAGGHPETPPTVELPS